MSASACPTAPVAVQCPGQGEGPGTAGSAPEGGREATRQHIYVLTCAARAYDACAQARTAVWAALRAYHVYILLPLGHSRTVKGEVLFPALVLLLMLLDELGPGVHPDYDPIG